MKPNLLLVAELPLAERNKLEETFAIHELWRAPDAADFLRDTGPSIRAVATRGDSGLDTASMAALPALEIVSVYGVGYDAVDVDQARARGIRVTNTPDVLTDDVADMAIALLLAVTRRIVDGDRHVRSGNWATGPMPLTTSLRGKTAGILGHINLNISIADTNGI